MATPGPYTASFKDRASNRPGGIRAGTLDAVSPYRTAPEKVTDPGPLPLDPSHSIVVRQVPAISKRLLAAYRPAT
jgi:hypothetical protein